MSKQDKLSDDAKRFIAVLSEAELKVPEQYQDAINTLWREAKQDDGSMDVTVISARLSSMAESLQHAVSPEAIDEVAQAWAHNKQKGTPVKFTELKRIARSRRGGGS
jgi:hypothetical protein